MGLLAGLALSVGLAADAPPAAAWNPLKWAGKSLASGAAEGLEPVLAATIDHTLASGNELVANVDTRLNKDIDKVGGVVKTTVSDVDTKLGGRIEQIDDSLEKRILQIQRGADDVAENLNKDLKQRLQQADDALKSRIDQANVVVSGALSQADGILAQRIADLDEAVERRLGNVDVIATKQRLAIEQTLLRVAVLIGLVVFVVIVLVRLWRRYGEISEEAAEAEATGPEADEANASGPEAAAAKTRARRRRVVQALGASLALQVGAAGVAAAALFLLYQRLPMGAARKANELGALHEKRLGESLASFDFSQARYHASQLELLRPENGARYRALAAKGDLMRDVVARPTLLTTTSGVSSIVERVNAVERELGAEADPDLLVVKAIVLWQVGRSRRDEHEAASLCARALRVAPGGFALAPLARSYVQDFLAAPYFDAATPLGRDAESADGLRSVLANVDVDARAFPLAPTLALRELTRSLERASSQAYVEMLTAHAEVVRRAGTPGAALEAARKRRTEQAAKVVEAWDAFMRAVDDVPGLAGTPAVLAVFKLNDVYYSRAKWFAVDRRRTDLAPLLSPDEGSSTVPAAERGRLAPPRIEWSRRYGALMGGLRNLIEVEEVARWRRLEKETQAFDRALVALLAPRPGDDVAALRRQAALHAARLGLYVEAPVGGRVAYATVLLGDLDAAAAGAGKRGETAEQKELTGIAQALALRRAV